MRTVQFLVLAAALQILTAYGPPALVEEPFGRAPITTATIAALDRVGAPSVQARAAIAFDVTTRTVAYAKEPDARLPNASTTKIVTALVAVDLLAPDARYPVTVAAEDLPGHSIAGLRRGDRLLGRDLLYGLLLPSGNDAALTIADGASGSVARFVAQMNERAAALGMRNTRFVNPHGFDAPDHFSSARDLALAAAALLADPRLAPIVRARQHTALGTWRYDWTNLNQLLTTRGDVTGVKTGTSDLAGPSLVASARRGDREAIVVLLGSPDRYAEAGRLLDALFEQFAIVDGRAPASPFAGNHGPAAPARLIPAWQRPLWWVDLRIPAEQGGPALMHGAERVQVPDA